MITERLRLEVTYRSSPFPCSSKTTVAKEIALMAMFLLLASSLQFVFYEMCFWTQGLWVDPCVPQEADR